MLGIRIGSQLLLMSLKKDDIFVRFRKIGPLPSNPFSKLRVGHHFSYKIFFTCHHFLRPRDGNLKLRLLLLPKFLLSVGMSQLELPKNKYS